MKIKYVASLVL